MGWNSKNSRTPSHYLYHTILPGRQLSWGKLRWEPATRWLDESFAPLPGCDERFARQHHRRPSTRLSSGFGHPRKRSSPFGSQQACSRLEPSGDDSVRVATWQTVWVKPGITLDKGVAFTTPRTVKGLRLAGLLNSLVRVTRRDVHPCLYQESSRTPAPPSDRKQPPPTHPEPNPVNQTRTQTESSNRAPAPTAATGW